MRTAAPTLRALPRLALRLPRRLRRLLVVALILAAALTATYYGWLRDSSLVQVRDVSVAGLTGPDAPRVRKLLQEAALGMTTLHVREDLLRRAVAAEPSIRSLRAMPDFPHGLRIDVLENHPVAAVTIPGSGRVPVAGNGTLMPAEKGGPAVPDLRIGGSIDIARSGDAPARLDDQAAARLVRVAASAPPALLRRASSIEQRAGQGIVVVLRGGPPVVFGDASRLPAKWEAAAGVLASSAATGATYVDVSLPDRPVAGGLRYPSTPGSTAPSTPQTPSTPATGSPATQPAGTCQSPPNCQAPPATPPAPTAATPSATNTQP
jgi:cell division protein FtsQ